MVWLLPGRGGGMLPERPRPGWRLNDNGEEMVQTECCFLPNIETLSNGRQELDITIRRTLAGGKQVLLTKQIM